MSTVSAATGPSAPQQTGSTSTIGGAGKGASFDKSSATVIQLSGKLRNTFRESFLRFDKIINTAVYTKDNLEEIQTLTSRSVAIARTAADPSTDDNERSALQSELRRNLKNIDKILKESDKEELDLKDKDLLKDLYQFLEIDLDTELESSNRLSKFTGIQLGSSATKNNQSIFAQDLSTQESAESALNALQKFDEALTSDIENIDNDIESLKKAQELSYVGFGVISRLDVSSISNIDQLSLKLGTEIRAKSSDFLISANSSLDEGAIEEVLN